MGAPHVGAALKEAPQANSPTLTAGGAFPLQQFGDRPVSWWLPSAAKVQGVLGQSSFVHIRNQQVDRREMVGRTVTSLTGQSHRVTHMGPAGFEGFGTASQEGASESKCRLESRRVR
jgi:hypothetical protein